MPRKYDRVIRFYASWFDDFTDPSKAFTAEELWQVVMAVRDAQLQGSIEPLDNLPISIRRALSMATMGEQIMRLLERADRMRERGSKGGQAARANQLSPEAQAAAQMKKQMEDKVISEREQKYEQQKATKINRVEYLDLLDRASKGDKSAADRLGITIDQAKNLKK